MEPISTNCDHSCPDTDLDHWSIKEPEDPSVLMPGTWDLHTLTADTKLPTSSNFELCSILLVHSKALLSLKKAIEQVEYTTMCISDTLQNVTSGTSDTGMSGRSTPTSDDSEISQDGSSTYEKKTPHRSKKVKFQATKKGTYSLPVQERYERQKKRLHVNIPKPMSSISQECDKISGALEPESTCQSVQLVTLRPTPLKVPIGIPREQVASLPGPQEPEKPSSPKPTSPTYVEHFVLSGTKKLSKPTLGPRRSSSTISASTTGNEKTSSTSSTVKTRRKSMLNMPCVPSKQAPQGSSQPIETDQVSSETTQATSQSKDE